MKAFVPIEKQSKKARCEFYKKRRGSWGAINPVTRKPSVPGAYKRKKIRKGEADGPSDADFLFVHNRL